MAGKTFNLHKVVLVSFKRPTVEGLEVNHINRDKGNCRLDNLEWLTPDANKKHWWSVPAARSRL